MNKTNQMNQTNQSNPPVLTFHVLRFTGTEDAAVRSVSAGIVLLIPHIVVNQAAAPVEFDRTTGFQHVPQLTPTPLDTRFHPRDRQTKPRRRLMLSQAIKID